MEEARQSMIISDKGFFIFTSFEYGGKFPMRRFSLIGAALIARAWTSFRSRKKRQTHSVGRVMDLRISINFICGLIGGMLAYYANAAAFLFGGILGTRVLFYERKGAELPILSKWVAGLYGCDRDHDRLYFTPDLLLLLPQFWMSAAVILILSRMLVISLFSGILAAIIRWMPISPDCRGHGGFHCAGRRKGADVRVVTVQHFIRIILL